MSIFVIQNDVTYCCGLNDVGQLGLDNNINQNILTEVPTNARFKIVSSCVTHTIALDHEGNIWTCGDNSYGQLGLGDNDDRDNLTLVASPIHIDNICNQPIKQYKQIK